MGNLDQEVVVTGRSGLKLPEIDFGTHTHPQLAIDFFDMLWIFNKFHYEDGNSMAFGGHRSPMGYRKTPQNEELVVPASDKHPVTVLRFAYTPPEAPNRSPVEEYDVLMAPTEAVGSFATFLTLTHRIRPSSGVAGDRDRLSIAHGDELIELSVYHEDDEFYTYDATQTAQQAIIGNMMRSCVEFLAT